MKIHFKETTIMDILFETMILQDLQKCFKVWGIEATEEKIKDIYRNNFSLKEAYLKVYQSMLKGK